VVRTPPVAGLRALSAASLLLAVLIAPVSAGSQPAPSGALASAPAAPAPARPPALDRPHEAGVVLVGFVAGATEADRAVARESVQARSATPLSKLAKDAEKVELGQGLTLERAIAVLQANPRVRYAEPNYLVQHEVVSNDPYYTNGSLWGMYGDASPLQVNQYGSAAAEAWAAGYIGSRDVVVGVIDEGLQDSHPDLAANIWTNPDEIAGNGIDDDGNGFIDDIHGWDFFHDDASTYDVGEDAHGTHVSGTIGGIGGNGLGVAGVNWAVTIVSAKFLGPGGGYIADAVNALDYLVDLKLNHDVNLVATSNSWGGGGFSQAMLDAINRGGDAGLLFVAAAGNANNNNDTLDNWPSNYQCTNNGTRGWDCVVAVAAIDSAGSRASFSSYGQTTVDLGAPGVGVWSSVPTNSYASYSGTSMATPHVSGAVALCKSINPALSAAQIRSAVVSSTTSTASMAGLTATGGRLDVAAMAAQCLPSTAVVSGGPGTLTATAASASKISLGWSDGATNETAWEIQRAPGTGPNPTDCGSFATIATIGTGATAYLASGLAPETKYCFRVRATNSFGGFSASGWSNLASATTLALPPPYVCASATYAWIDATSGGTQRALTDDSSVGVALPFSFPFYGDAISSVQVSSNGYLRLGSGAATSYSNVPIPNLGDPNAFAAAFWDDLNPGAGGSVWTRTVGSAPNRQFVAAWIGVPHFNLAGSALTFEIVLDEASGAVLFQYQDVIAGNAAYDRGASATAGIENGDGSAGTQLVYNAPALSDLTAWRCTAGSGPVAPTITTSSLPDGTVSAAYSATVQASGGQQPYTFSVTAGSLPAGLSLSTGGAISGAPTGGAGTASFTVQVRGNDGATSTRDLSIRVATALAVTTSNLPGGGLGTAYNASLAASGGQTPYSWRLQAGSSLPPGLGLGSTGAITGTPTALGTYPFTVEVTDAGNPTRTASRALSITIGGSPPGAFGKTAPKNNAKLAPTGSVTLSWASSSGATSYQYCVSTTNGVCASWIDVGTATSFVVTGVSPRTNDWWEVRAVNGAGTTLANGGTWWKYSTR
jgi:subtilisin family serine protease